MMVTLWNTMIDTISKEVLAGWGVTLALGIFATQKVVTTLLKRYTNTTKHTPEELSEATTISPKELMATLKWLKKYREEIEQKENPLTSFSPKTTTKEANPIFASNQQCAVIVTTDIYNPKSYIIPTQDSPTVYQLLSQQESIIKIIGFLKEKGFETKILKSENGHLIPASPISQMNAKSQHPIQFPSNIFTLN